MMRRSGQGECSRKSPPSDDSDRPFKKAKYVWQLKGKYHLKEQYKHSNVDDTKNIQVEEQENVPNDTSRTNACNREDHNKICTCLTTLIAHSNSILENEESDQDMSGVDRPIYDDTPVTLVTPRRENHDEYLEKWQARQMVKSFIDNTINTTLEQWKLAPTEALDFVENCDNENVEDEGIMMAIQSHGLQSNADRYPNTYEGQASCVETMVQTSENCQNDKKEVCMNVADTDMVCDSEVSRNEADQMDFLSTAVTMAIQKKGLSSYSYG